MIMGSALSLDADYISTHANVIADDISRLKRSADGQYDHSKLLSALLMPHISALQKPSYNALGHHVEQRLSGSVDHKAAQTRDSRLVHFLAYIDEYELTDKYLNHSSSIVDDILSRYVLLLFMG
jgi:hypothetical protein